MSANAEYGVFSESAGGCVYAPCHSPEEAEQERARMVAEDGEDADDLTVQELCPDHAEQPRHGCEECAADNDDDQDDGEG